MPDAVVITCSTRAASGVYPDTSGQLLASALREWGFAVAEPVVVADGAPVGEALRAALASGVDLALTTGGTGLNLTRADHVIHVDRWWNPAVEDQATDRAYRIGQDQKVSVHRFVCVGTIEERIDDMIAKKRELSRLTVAAGEKITLAPRSLLVLRKTA